MPRIFEEIRGHGRTRLSFGKLGMAKPLRVVPTSSTALTKRYIGKRHPMAADSPSPPEESSSPRKSLWELAALYLKLGTIAFGGPAAHVALMEDEVVRRRGWL